MNNQYIVKLKPTKHKRKSKHQVILTSYDVDDASVVRRYSPNGIFLIALIICMVGGVLFGLLYFQQQNAQKYESRLAEKDYAIAQLETEKEGLNSKINELQDTVVILSNTVTNKVASEVALTQTLEAQALPTEFPLTGSANIDEAEDEDVHPMIIFTVGDGSSVVSSASGVVEEVGVNSLYGNYVIIDHQNGYRTIYMNGSDVLVRSGDFVVQGTALFVIGNNNNKLIYQMTYDNEYINPLDMLSING